MQIERDQPSGVGPQRVEHAQRRLARLRASGWRELIITCNISALISPDQPVL
jgi:hypothetical protein